MLYVIPSGLVTALLSEPIHINTQTQDADCHALLMDNERARKFKDLLYTNKIVQANVRRLLPFYDRRGLLDC